MASHEPDKLLRYHMRRAANRFRSFLLLAGFAVSMSACEVMPDPEFAALQEALSVRAVDAKRNVSGSSIDVSFELTNRSNTIARACLGPSRSLHYRLGSGLGIFDRSFDHAGCAREFTIESRGLMS